MILYKSRILLDKEFDADQSESFCTQSCMIWFHGTHASRNNWVGRASYLVYILVPAGSYLRLQKLQYAFEMGTPVLHLVGYVILIIYSRFVSTSASRTF